PRPLPDRLAARLDRRRHGRGFRGPRRGLRRRCGVGRRAGRVPPPPLLRCGPARTPRCGERMTMSYLRIATEEAYAPAELFDLYRELLPDTDDIGFRSLMGHYLTSDAERPRFVRSRLTDLGETRLSEMDAAGVHHAVLALTSPGTQVLEDKHAREMATLANERIAEAVRKHPTR